MFKLLRDSLFNPKNIIHYRAKKFGFVFLYVLIVSLVYAISLASTPLSYDGLDYKEKLDLTSCLSSTGAKVTDYKYDANSSFIVEIGDYNVGFLSASEDVSTYISNYDASFIVYDSYLYIVSQSGYSVQAMKIVSLEKILGENFKNCIFAGMNVDDPFLTRLNNVLVSYKPVFIAFYAITGLISGAMTMLFYAFLSYIFLNLSINASKYMKKKQLFTMMIFSSTGIVIAESINYLFSFSTIISLLVMIAGFIPLYVLEREFIRRIRIQKFGESVMDNENVINKINEMLHKNEDENKDDDNNKGE